MNHQPITGAKDAETDAAYRARFIEFLGSLSKATGPAIDTAVREVQQGLSWIKLENRTPDGQSRPGFFSIVAEDGSGGLPAAVHDEIVAAVDAIRPFTVGFGVFAPTVVTVDVALNAILAPGADGAAVRSAIQNAVAAYLAGLDIGIPVYHSRIVHLAMDAAPGLLAIENVTLGGRSSDFAIGPTQIARPGQILIG